MRRVLKAVGRLWYGFVIGDDWTVAATVAVAVVLTWSLHVFGLAAWWLPPFYVVVALGISLRRTGQQATALLTDSRRTSRPTKGQPRR